jgi:hypothetical protein
VLVVGMLLQLLVMLLCLQLLCLQLLPLLQSEAEYAQRPHLQVT